ncbi:homocysteine S-methyltransferase family protein [Thalassococcus sp. CAU 1522]|uniref:Homocysteine S-methyltransferase family protein n=1 Tax=Thalassococcus arenae TaxID=2851652 RepID=A0ABS6N844_9RHOB|nr:homocysteine S-methyltransferase family protein [Thalassococcus arenae]MBV2360171.1 homocysteine S-methyltransferase family protein [Thalassococcus arenae]
MTGITLLDGGMGQELIHRAGDRPTPLWSTQVMRDHPGLVRAVHADYFAAGATIATTNTYALHRDRLAPAGIEDEWPALVDAALDEAAAARVAHGAGRIAGSVGPLGASYRPDIHPDHATAVPLYRELVAALAPRVDLVLFETVASVDHARAAVAAGQGCGKPVWIAVTVDDEDGRHLRSGEPVADVVTVLADGADAVLANCSAPEAMPKALEILMKTGLPFGAYGNAFTQITKDFLKDRPTVDALSARRDMGPEAYAGHAMTWIGQGATIVGGCCETGPAHIAEIAARLRAAGHAIV